MHKSDPYSELTWTVNNKRHSATMIHEMRPSKMRKLSHDDQQATSSPGGRLPGPRNDDERGMNLSDDVTEHTRLKRSETVGLTTNGRLLEHAGSYQNTDKPETVWGPAGTQRANGPGGQALPDSQIQREQYGKPSDPSHQQAGDMSDPGSLAQSPHQPSPETATLPIPDETAPLAGTVEHDHGAVPMSKSQQKKLRKKLDWESKRDERKVIRKEKLVAKRERRRAAKQQPTIEDGESVPSLPPPKKQPAQRPVQLPITIVIDCDFDHLMRDNERISLASQLTRCYSDNKNSMFRAHLALCSFGGRLKERFDSVLNKNYESWRGVRTMDCHFSDAAERARVWMRDNAVLGGAFAKYDQQDGSARLSPQTEGEIVYLSSEASEDLRELKPYSTYIIGGLVDKNHEKGICYKRASARNVRTARLPIGEFMDMSSRKVLATNHVNEIMLKWLECGDWGEAFMRVIPKRKGGKLKGGDASKAADEHAAGHKGDDEQADTDLAEGNNPRLAAASGQSDKDVGLNRVTYHNKDCDVALER